MCWLKKKIKNLKMFERFAQGNLCVELEGSLNVICDFVFIVAVFCLAQLDSFVESNCRSNFVEHHLTQTCVPSP